VHVLFVTPELAPVVHVGGIAEGLSAMARALVGLGVRVTVALPGHASADLRGVERTDDDATLSIPTPEGVVPVTASRGRLGSGVGVLVVDTPELASRPHVYGEDMHDATNARRWALFARAVVDLVVADEAAGRGYDVVHLHEWPVAMVAYLLKQRSRLPRARTMLTLHNLAHQGIFPRACLDALALGPEHADDTRLGFHGLVNYLKGGILAADALTTVSPTYARQILQAPFGELLEPWLGARADRLTGLVNGIDEELWNPRRDAALAAPFDADDLAGKRACKAAFLSEVGLTDCDDRPLVVSVGRLVPQKGSDLLARALPALLGAGAAVLVAGTGDGDLTEEVRAEAARSPARARYLGYVPDTTVRRLVAAADIVAMPSRFEPCGIVQLYALAYGAIPVVARTGGLVDTVVDAASDEARGTGFFQDAPTPEALATAIVRAIGALRSPVGAELQRRGMRAQNGWRWRVLPYRAAYDALVRAHPSPMPRG